MRGDGITKNPQREIKEKKGKRNREQMGQIENSYEDERLKHNHNKNHIKWKC